MTILVHQPQTFLRLHKIQNVLLTVLRPKSIHTAKQLLLADESIHTAKTQLLKNKMYSYSKETVTEGQNVLIQQGNSY